MKDHLLLKYIDKIKKKHDLLYLAIDTIDYSGLDWCIAARKDHGFLRKKLFRTPKESSFFEALDYFVKNNPSFFDFT